MIKLDEPFKQDAQKIWYIDDKDINITSFSFNELINGYHEFEKRHFFKIDGLDEYIIKDTTARPFWFNAQKTKKFLKTFNEKQPLIPDVDFPVGYYKKNDKVKGTIIPYYKDALPIRNLIYLYKLEQLKDFYSHDSDEIDNLISLCLDILDLISKMYNENVVYLDIHSGNFIIYENEVKVIDFEPGYVYFADKKGQHYHRLIRNYVMLVENICRHFDFKHVLLHSGDTFMETEIKVKRFIKSLER